MKILATLYLLQVAGKVELCEVLTMLFSNAKALEAHRIAAKQAFQALSHGISGNVFNLLQHHVFRKAAEEIKGT